MGGKKKQTVGYWYRPAFHHGLCKGPIDAFLEFRGGTKTAWSGELTASGEIFVNAPTLWGGEKDQGGIQGNVDVLFGEATQEPNPYLLATFGPQIPAWRGFCTVVFKGGRYGALNPYPQKASYKIRKIKAGWDDECWYEEAAEITQGLVVSMNPAHVLYFSHTNSDMGRQPVESINEASLEAAADALLAEGFGICTQRDPARESVETFQQRIARLIDGSFTRSLVDGQWYLDLVRGPADIEALEVLTDDDILQFQEIPSTLDNAINSASVRYFDPVIKEFVVTPAARVMALVRQFGEIHQTYDYPEIPHADLALKIAQREVLATSRPTRAFALVTNRKPYAWRKNQYFRLQAPKRGIADMVCIVGENQSGTLKSGAIRLKAVQHIYSLPSATYIEMEPGVDLTPLQTPVPIELQRAFEAPYIDIVATLPRAEMLVLPEEVGFLKAVAVDPAECIDFTLMAEPAGGEYEETANGDWCPSATVVEAATCVTTSFTLANAYRLDEVTVGLAVLYEDEVCRVDAIDADALTITLARGCADTVPVHHTAGRRLWFWPEGHAADPTEYTDGETVNAKLLPNTGSQQLHIDDAAELSVTFDQRLVRPYPPANLQINGVSCPTSIVGATANVTWAHRDRLLQEDQLVDTTAADIGPEADTTYAVSYIDVGASSILETHSGLTGTSDSFEFPPETVTARVEVVAVRGGLQSWQTNFHEFTIQPAAEVFTSSGTWNKPPNLDFIEVIAIGAGGGGASGSLSAGANSTTAANAQRAGGGGGRARRIIAAADLPSTVAVTVGVGGTGGAARSGTPSNPGGGINGFSGTAGGDSTFGSFVTATGGGGAPFGSGGVITRGTQTVPGGTPLDMDGIDNLTWGGQGGNAGDIADPTNIPGGKGRFGAGGGGPGGSGRFGDPGAGFSQIVIDAMAGGKGSDWTIGVGHSGGVTTGGGGTANGGDGADASVEGMCGDGGGGGEVGVGAPGGNAGHGGFPGGGGGGGGPTLLANGSSGTSGAGGDGADGMVIVIPTFL